MRVLALLPLLMFLVPAASAAAEEPERIERLHVGMGHPAPDVHARVYEHPGCVFHRVAWDGWFTAADASVWAWEDRDPGRVADLDDRLDGALLALGAKAVGWFVEVAQRWPSWYEAPLDAPLWAVDQVGHEDVCALGLVDVSTNLEG